MITIKITHAKLLEQKADCFIFPLEQDFDFSKELSGLAKKYFPELEELFKERDFVGRANSSLFLPVSDKGRVINFVFVGLGKAGANKHFSLEQYRRMVGRLVRTVEGHKYHSVAMELPSAKLFGVSAEYLAQQTAIIVQMSSYHFDKYITDPDAKVRHVFEMTLVIKQATEEKTVLKGVADGMVIAEAVNSARYWVDLPPEETTPEFLANQARAIAKKHKLKITVFSEKEINAMGMGGLAAVARGSDLDCQLVIMEYKTSKKNAETLAIVGKGITFDSGGLSIKPASSMETMKSDMSGAAAVIATMDALAVLKPDVNIICVAPIAENLPSGGAIRPGDIATFYNGKTAEIKNTDAEGRLILADALSYTVKHYKPDYMIDLATLTGSCSAALGPVFAGMMSQHDDFVTKVQDAANVSGDRVWRLPLDNDYKVAIKSSVADMQNIGSPRYMAGAITATFFLQHFVGDVPWVHLDIAGVAFDVPDISYYRSGAGATGFGVRLLVALAMNWKK
jgi:leucyl aminopeptidase